MPFNGVDTMKKILKLILIFSLTTLMNCYGEDDFSYEKFQFLEDTEWFTSLDVWSDDGVAKFIRIDKYEKLLQQKWYSGSFDIFADVGDNTIIHLGASAECNIEYRNNLDLMIIRSSGDDLYSDAVKRMGGTNSKNNLLGRWSFLTMDEFKYEYRELPWDDDYVYLFYIEGLERRLEGDRQNDIFSGWFLLKYQGEGVFVTDGVYEDDSYILKIIDKATLQFSTNFEHVKDFDNAPIVGAYYRSNYWVFAKK